MRSRTVMGLAAVGLMLAAAMPVRANNLVVTNVAVTPRDATTAYVEFDVSWDNSWRYTNVNHDAAWVFFKAQREGQTDWTNVVLEYDGVNPTGSSTGMGTAVELVVPDDKVGLFVRPAGEGSGPVAVTGVKVVWNFATSGFETTSKVKMRALAVEMVYVAEGDFAAGSGGTEANKFTLTTINTTNATTAPSGSGSLGGEGGGYPTGQTVPANASWPNGYAAFYCMKYEITRGQYKDFLNTLTLAQATPRNLGYTGSHPNFTTVAPDGACGNISWADGAAFADWSGLRPMTELEYEKACRGPLTPVPDEYAWGSTTIIGISGLQGTAGSGSEYYTAGNVNFGGNGGPGGPTRVGIFAKAATSREAAGASYWGIMELSGNLWERAVTIGNPDGRNFTGLHGDGNLNATGDANVTAWPGTTASGAGVRGAGYAETSPNARTSDRSTAALTHTGRVTTWGWRAVRAAPSGLPAAP